MRPLTSSLFEKGRRGLSRLGRAAVAVGAACVLLAALTALGACGRREAAPSDDFAAYRSAVKPEFQGDFDLAADGPRYAIEVSLNPTATQLTGVAQVQVTNTSEDPWPHVVFRLYPVLEHYGGEMTILSALADGAPSTYIYEADNTAVRVDLPQALLPGQTTTIGLSWRLEIPEWQDNPSAYVLFGRSQGMVSLPLFYPSLAVYEPGPAIGTGHWWEEEGSGRGDVAFNAASLFSVTAILPSEFVPVTSGTLITSTALGDGQSRHTWVTGPSREFLLHLSPNFESASQTAYGTTVTSYWLPGQEAGGRAALRFVVAALRFYSDYFGEYPFADLRVAPAPLSVRGMEYPQVSLLGTELYDRAVDDMEIRAVHETAHQWWYQLVHNDPVRTPWLDEALAEYSSALFNAAVRGRAKADLLMQQRWQTPVDLLAAERMDVPIDQPVDRFENGSQYETVIYAKGALLYDRLHAALGDREFRHLMRDYLRQFRYRIVGTDAWLGAMQAAGNPEVDALVDRWVRPRQTRPLPTGEPVTDTLSTGDAQAAE